MSAPDTPASDDDRFGLDALPYGVFSVGAGPRGVGVRYGGHVIDLARLAAAAAPQFAEVFAAPTLNPFLARGRPAWTAARRWIRELLAADGPEVAAARRPLAEVTLHLPIEVADYVDFYANEHHAGNVGRIFRPGAPALPPNWKHLPIGYHGRSATVVVDGTDVVRPSGQRKEPDADLPTFGPSRRLDIEAELGFVVGRASEWTVPVPIADAAEHLFGVVVLNDWSARDIQAWETVPLGPFLGKSFATSISAWVLPWEALAEARFPLPVQDPKPLPYLCGEVVSGLDIHFRIELNGEVVSRPEYSTMYWAPEQMLAHLTVNGATTRVGDLFGSGTVSGPERGTRGSFLELSWQGAEPIQLADGTVRSFLEDGDTVVITAWAPGPGGARIGLGRVGATVRAAR